MHICCFSRHLARNKKQMNEMSKILRLFVLCASIVTLLTAIVFGTSISKKETDKMMFGENRVAIILPSVYN